MKINFKKMLSLLAAGCLSFSSLPLLANPVFTKIATDQAPEAYGAYSQAIALDLEQTKKLIFVSGQVPINPINGEMENENIRKATNQTLDNIEAILKAGGSDWKYVVRTDVFLKNFDRDWEGMNEEYAKRFPDGIFPARQTVGVKMGDTLIEISCIAIVPKGDNNL